MKLKDVPIGELVEYPDFKYLDATVTFQVVAQNHYLNDNDYPENSTTLQTKDIITNKAFDAKEASNSNSDRRKNGNNNYFVSNISQWLTSSATNWFKAQHGADAVPNSTNVVSANPYAEEAGFLSNMPEEFREALLPTTLTTVQPSVDGGGVKKEVRTVFLPSRTEVGLGDEASDSPEGAKWDFYTDNNSRKKVRTPQATSQATSSEDWWWLRTPHVDYADLARHARSDGTLNNSLAYYGYYGVSPALNLSNEVEVELVGGKYIIQGFLSTPNLKINVNGIARQATDMYINVNGIARKITKMYVNVNGTAREVK